MADPRHLALFRIGATAWNKWRSEEPRLQVDLAGASFVGENLSGRSLLGANLTDTNFAGATLRDVNFERAVISRAVFRGAHLVGADFTGAVISDSDFSDAILGRCIFNYARIDSTSFAHANLRESVFGMATLHIVDMSSADLQNATFNRTLAVGVNFAACVFGNTILADTSILDGRNLQLIKHEYRSSVGMDTFLASSGLPAEFLRGVGIAPEFVAHAASFVGNHAGFSSCFISYASLDDAFARRLYGDLQSNNVKTWFAPDDLRVGDSFRSEIAKAIKRYDKLLIVLSTAALNSRWVEMEVETAFAREVSEKRDILLPVCIDDSIYSSGSPAWVDTIVNMRHVGDFRNWRNRNDYTQALDRLLLALRVQRAIETGQAAIAKDESDDANSLKLEPGFLSMDLALSKVWKWTKSRLFPGKDRNE